MKEKIKLYVRGIRQETADTITLHFSQPEQKLNYTSGQYLTLISEINGKEVRRAYSICSSPYTDNNLSVAVKRIKGGNMSNHLHENIVVGDELFVLPPMGNFTFKPDNISKHIVLIGGGSGITPLFSIIKSALVKEPDSKVSLIYVNSSLESTIYYEELEQWHFDFSSGFRIIHHWSDEMKEKQPQRSFFSSLFKKSSPNAHRIDATRLQTIFRDLHISKEKNTVFYVCGPLQLMEMAVNTIRKIGFSKDVILKESFYTSEKVKNASTHSTQEHQIKILFKGKEHPVKVKAGTPILFAGLEAGVNLSYSCQSGNCTTCVGRCVSGEVEMSTIEGLTNQQLNDGYILTCVGYPKSDDVVIEFK
ncbi:MAG: ferredoxin--NADP reductase [Sediminicola sp.]|tara:strand:- start:883 stop:1968 length:1086 start_codon:yes stop_codon:yes gene_type:complete